MKKFTIRTLSIICVLLIMISFTACRTLIVKQMKKNNTSSKDTENSLSQTFGDVSTSFSIQSNHSYKPNSSATSSANTYSRATSSTASKNDEAPILSNQITNVNDLLQFANNVKNGYSYAGETITLKNDIDLSGVEWEPIGNHNKPFSGVFEGNNHKISNLKVTSVANSKSGDRSAYIGFFGCITDGEVNNLTVENINISINISNTDNISDASVGGIVGFMDTYDKDISLSNCKTTGNINVIDDTNKAVISIGGLIGDFATNQYNDSYNMNMLYSSVNINASGNWINAGGIVGCALLCQKGYSANISDLIYKGTIKYYAKIFRGGGFAGIVHAEKNTGIKNCYFSLNLVDEKSSSLVGYVVGDMTSSSNRLKLENIYANATLNSKNAEISFVGRSSSTISLNNCYNVDTMPQDVPFDTTNWDLTDPASPKFK